MTLWQDWTCYLPVHAVIIKFNALDCKLYYIKLSSKFNTNGTTFLCPALHVKPVDHTLGTGRCSFQLVGRLCVLQRCCHLASTFMNPSQLTDRCFYVTAYLVAIENCPFITTFIKFNMKECTFSIIYFEIFSTRSMRIKI